MKRASGSSLAALLQLVVVAEVVVVVVNKAVARHLVLCKFTKFLKFVVNLKSFKVITKLMERSPLDIFLNSAGASCVVIVAAVRLEQCCTNFQNNFKPFWRHMEVYLQVFKLSSTCHYNKAPKSRHRKRVC